MRGGPLAAHRHTSSPARSSGSRCLVRARVRVRGGVGVRVRVGARARVGARVRVRIRVTEPRRASLGAGAHERLVRWFAPLPAHAIAVVAGAEQAVGLEEAAARALGWRRAVGEAPHLVSRVRVRVRLGLGLGLGFGFGFGFGTGLGVRVRVRVRD